MRQKQVDIVGGHMVEDAAGAAAHGGMRSGGAVLSAGATPVKSAAQLQPLLARAAKHVALLVQRDPGKMFVRLDPGQEHIADRHTYGTGHATYEF